MKGIPGTPAELVEHWKWKGYQHFHLVTVPGSGRMRGPRKTWVPIFCLGTPVCRDPGRCLILKIADSRHHD